MKSIESLVKDLDKAIVTEEAVYLDCHEELKQYNNVPIDDTNVHQINDILTRMQNSFTKLNHAYNFINYRFTPAFNYVNNYKAFIERIKQSGAKPNDEL